MSKNRTLLAVEEFEKSLLEEDEQNWFEVNISREVGIGDTINFWKDGLTRFNPAWYENSLWK